MKEEEKMALLDAVLTSPFVEEARKNRNLQEEIDFYGSRLRLVEFLRDQIDEFLSGQDLEEIVKVEPIWKHLQEEIKGDIDGILSDKKYFAKEQDWNLEEKTRDHLKTLGEMLIRILKKRFIDHWHTQTLEDAKKYLQKDKGVFVVLLTKDGKVCDEPYPIHHVTEINFTVVAEESKPRESWMKPHTILYAKFKEPIELEGHKITALFICEMPEDYNKAEVLKFP